MNAVARATTTVSASALRRGLGSKRFNPLAAAPKAVASKKAFSVQANSSKSDGPPLYAEGELARFQLVPAGDGVAAAFDRRCSNKRALPDTASKIAFALRHKTRPLGIAEVVAVAAAGEACEVGARRVHLGEHRRQLFLLLLHEVPELLPERGREVAVLRVQLRVPVLELRIARHARRPELRQHGVQDLWAEAAEARI